MLFVYVITFTFHSYKMRCLGLSKKDPHRLLFKSYSGKIQNFRNINVFSLRSIALKVDFSMQVMDFQKFLFFSIFCHFFKKSYVFFKIFNLTRLKKLFSPNLRTEKIYFEWFSEKIRKILKARKTWSKILRENKHLMTKI